ncbi:MAG: MBL fold metallo-hydrolase [Acidobacteria bacterium]|nr:MBL fold metallo-hydrolase [Acidobacteriota bacterium]
MTRCRLAPLALSVLVALPSFAHAQAPAASPAKPDSPRVQALIQQAKKAAGARWADEAHFFCEAPRGNSPNDPPVAPTKIFDNVSVIGNAGTVVYVVQTSAGLLMFDSMAANQVQTQLLPGFTQLGLDPANVKTIVMGHGHADHFGGSPYFQDHFGSTIYISAADWNLMANPPPGRSGQPAAPAPVLPKHDRVVAEGQPIVLGDFSVMPIAIPGHTPGSMGYIFPVRDNGRTRMAAMYGGTILNPGPISDEGLQTYRTSLAHFKEETRKAKVEIVLQNHPLMDPVQPKLEKMRSRKPGDPNPWVVGEANYQTFVDVMSRCTDVNLARRK